MPSWFAPIVAVSLVVIALSFLAMGVAVSVLARRGAIEARRLSEELGEFRREIAPTIQAVRRLVENTGELAEKVRDEVLAIVATSGEVREDVAEGIEKIKDRLEDLGALYEVMHEEVEETALDVAATLRTARTGTGVLARLGRFLGRRR
ncbi:MAG: hypothetical protein ABI647_19875 [Gemmatimonadota bacterium]